MISPVEYDRLLKTEIRVTKLEEITKNKAIEIRRLQNQVASLKRQLLKRTGETCEQTNESELCEVKQTY